MELRGAQHPPIWCVPMGYTDDEVTVYRDLPVGPGTIRIELPYILEQSTHLKTSASVSFAKPICASISAVGSATTGVRDVGVVGEQFAKREQALMREEAESGCDMGSSACHQEPVVGEPSPFPKSGPGCRIQICKQRQITYAMSLAASNSNLPLRRP